MKKGRKVPKYKGKDIADSQRGSVQANRVARGKGGNQTLLRCKSMYLNAHSGTDKASVQEG